MKRSSKLSLIVILVTVFVSNAFGESPVNTTVDPGSLDDLKDNYWGDRIFFQQDIPAWIVDTGKDPYEIKAVCIPYWAELRGTGAAKFREGANESKTYNLFYVEALYKPHKECKNAKPESAGETTSSSTSAAEVATINEDDVVMIKDSVLSSLPPMRFGFVYGTLTVPYKYFPKLKSRKQTSPKLLGSSTVGGYFGVRRPFDFISDIFNSDLFLLGVDLQAIVFCGTVPITIEEQDASGQSTSSTAMGVSYGGGLVGQIKQRFSLGFVFGTDIVDKKVHYSNNGKLWIAAELGYSFVK